MGKEYKIDDSIVFKRVDETLANIDITRLEKVREELVKNGEDTFLIDKAIKERKRRDEIIMKNKKEQEKNRRTGLGGAILFGLLEGFASGSSKSSKKSDNDLMPWEEDALKHEGYEKYNFEEEELEEDDYYYDDDK